MAARELQNILSKHDIELEKDEMEDLMLQLAGWATTNFGGKGKVKVSSRKGKPTKRVTWWNLMLSVGKKDSDVPDFDIVLDKRTLRELKRTKSEKSELAVRLIEELVAREIVELGERYGYLDVAKYCIAVSEEILPKKLKAPSVHSALRPFIPKEEIDHLKELAKEKTERLRGVANAGAGGQEESDDETPIPPPVKKQQQKRTFTISRARKQPKIVVESESEGEHKAGGGGEEEEEVDF